MQKFALAMRDEGNSEKDVFLNSESLPSAVEIYAACRDWVECGAWGRDGACIWVGWTLTDERGRKIDEGYERIEIEAERTTCSVCGVDATHKTSEGTPSCWSHT